MFKITIKYVAAALALTAVGVCGVPVAAVAADLMVFGSFLALPVLIVRAAR